MAKQIPNACVTSIMEYANNKVFGGGSINESVGNFNQRNAKTEKLVYWNVSLVCPANYGEILDSTGGDDNVLFPEYQTYMSITDNGYGNGFANSFAGGSINESVGNFNQRNAKTEKLVYWGESHDTYANDGGESKNKSTTAYHILIRTRLEPLAVASAIGYSHVTVRMSTR